MLQSCQKYVQFTAFCLNIHENMRFTDEGTALVAFLPSIKEGHNMGNEKKYCHSEAGAFSSMPGKTIRGIHCIHGKGNDNEVL